MLVLHQGIVRILVLLANSFILYEVQLECGHFAFRKQWRVFAQPQIPQQIAPAFLILLACMQVKSGAHARVNSVEQRATLQRAPKQRRFLQAAIGVQRHGGMEQQGAVGHGVQAARIKEQRNVALQAL